LDVAVFSFSPIPALRTRCQHPPTHPPPHFRLFTPFRVFRAVRIIALTIPPPLLPPTFSSFFFSPPSFHTGRRPFLFYCNHVCFLLRLMGPAIPCSYNVATPLIPVVKPSHLSFPIYFLSGLGFSSTLEPTRAYPRILTCASPLSVWFFPPHGFRPCPSPHSPQTAQ